MNCPNCKYEIDDNTASCPYCHTQISNVPAEETQIIPDTPAPQKKSKKTVSIVSVLVAVACTFIGRFAGQQFAGGISKANDFRKIDKFIEKVEDYKPGVLTENNYKSTHFGLCFEANDNWVMYQEEDLIPQTESIAYSTTKSATDNLRKQGAPEDLIEKYESSVYVKCEMGAAYVLEDYLYGEVLLNVMTAYGFDDNDYDLDSYVDGLYKEFSGMATNLTKGTETLAGNEYKKITATINTEGIDIVNTIYVTQKDCMLAMIACRAVEGYDKEVTESFLENLEALN